MGQEECFFIKFTTKIKFHNMFHKEFLQKKTIQIIKKTPKKCSQAELIVFHIKFYLLSSWCFFWCLFWENF